MKKISNKLKKQMEEFENIVRELNQESLCSFDKSFIDLYLRSKREISTRLFRAFPDIIERIKWHWNYQLEEERKRKEVNENLIGILEEYLSLFKNKQEHKKAHKKELCPKCELAKQFIEKLKQK